MSATVPATITISEPTPGNYVATVPKTIAMRPAQFVAWTIVEPTVIGSTGAPTTFSFPVFVQEYKLNGSGKKVAQKKGCFLLGVDGRQDGNRVSSKNHKVEERVGLQLGTFDYYVGYIDATGKDQMLVDPEIVVDGDPDLSPAERDAIKALLTANTRRRGATKTIATRRGQAAAKKRRRSATTKKR
jgi:hypothetical protein